MIEDLTKRLFNTARRVPLRVHYAEEFRLPLSSGEHSALELRRADEAVHYALSVAAIAVESVITPAPISYDDLLAIHAPDYLESLHQAPTLAQIFAVDSSDVVVDQLMHAIRLGCGATLQAAQHTLEHQVPNFNLFGGFHHARRGHGSGFCALNDVMCAIARLRRAGFTKPIAIIDVDFHPPDGLDELLAEQPALFEPRSLSSLSGAHWTSLRRADETVLPKGCPDDRYLDALDRLLSRVGDFELAFVLAGADVLAGDKLGGLGLSLAGLRQRDLRIKRFLNGKPQVWLSAGGYSPHAWKALAGTILALALDSEQPIPLDYEPTERRLTNISSSLSPEQLGQPPTDEFMSPSEVAELFGQVTRGERRFMGFYSKQGLEYALERYRILPYVRRLGYSNLHVQFENADPFEKALLRATDVVTQKVHTLMELEVARRRIDEVECLFVNWLSLKNPKAQFSGVRPQLPGQEVPGLGLARECIHLLTLMAQRLNLQAVAFQPSWYHMAWAARHDSRFVSPERQGRFEALMRDLRHVSLLEATRAVAENRVRLNEQPYAWEADPMLQFREGETPLVDPERVNREKERCRFSIT